MPASIFTNGALLFTLYFSLESDARNVFYLSPMQHEMDYTMFILEVIYDDGL